MNRTTPLFAALALLASVARAQEPAPGPVDSTVHRHLGFYLNLNTGLGGSSLSSGGASSGDGATLGGVSVGGALSENLILAGSLWGSSQFRKTTTLSLSDDRLTMGGLGAELRYYFMPANVFVAVTPSLAVANLRAGTKDAIAGFGVLGAVGKEWWVGDHWGLGVGGQFFAMSLSSNGVSASGFGGGVVFSATYN